MVRLLRIQFPYKEPLNAQEWRFKDSNWKEALCFITKATRDNTAFLLNIDTNPTNLFFPPKFNLLKPPPNNWKKGLNFLTVIKMS
ncbi:hypothetical protein HanPSC8_Chr10g0443761 [Helianthus annuus]|nr:hypothetical protein HanPSC8_Chr10g0443761 [Helianthus annuus]